MATLRQYPGWFILPVSNLLFYRLGHWGEGVGHYWTMAVDEQFYLLWPLLLGLLGRRVSTQLAVVVASVLFRIWWSLHVTPTLTFVLLPACLDMFALGGVLRIIEPLGWVRRLARSRWVLVAWAAWAAIWGLLEVLHSHAVWLLISTTVGGLASQAASNPAAPDYALHGLQKLTGLLVAMADRDDLRDPSVSEQRDNLTSATNRLGEANTSLRPGFVAAASLMRAMQQKAYPDLQPQADALVALAGQLSGRSATAAEQRQNQQFLTQAAAAVRVLSEPR